MSILDRPLRLAGGLRRRAPRGSVFLVMARPADHCEVEAVEAQAAEAGCRLIRLEGADAGDARERAALLELCRQQGLDEAWMAGQLAEGAVAHVALAGADGRAAAMGFVARGAFEVAEIRHTLDPGEGGCYLYATYVAPAERGRRLQRLVDLHRIAWARRAWGSRRAYAVVEVSNRASVRGHAASGFEPVVRVRLWESGRAGVALLRRLRAATQGAPALRPEGRALGAGVHWLR